MNAQVPVADKPFTVEKLQEKVRKFGELLGEIIREQEDEAVYQAVEKLRRGYIHLQKQEDSNLRQELMEFIAGLDVELLEKSYPRFQYLLYYYQYC